MEVASCPGCSSRDFGVSRGTGSAFETVVGDCSFEQPDYEVRVCHHCGLYYKSNILHPEDLAHYYHQVDFTKWDIGELYPSEKAILSVLNQLPAGSKVLDYGCSDGRLLSHLDDRYHKFGFELNEAAARIARQKQISILSKDEIVTPSSLSFDAVVLSDIYEHLVNPTEVLKSLRERLSARGLLILFTGDGDSKACQRDVANFWYFRTVEHLCMLSKKHSEYLCRQLNMRLISWTKMSHYNFTLGQIARQRVQDFAYWQFQRNSSSIMSSVLKITPILRRAKHWVHPPAINCTKDHVLAVFKSQH